MSGHKPWKDIKRKSQEPKLFPYPRTTWEEWLEHIIWDINNNKHVHDHQCPKTCEPIWNHQMEALDEYYKQWGVVQ